MTAVKRIGAAGLAAIMIAVLVVATPSPAPAYDEGDISIDLRVRGGEEGRFQTGQEVTFYFETDEDCYVVIYNVDAAGRVNLLFPEEPDGSSYVRAGRRYRIPEHDGGYQLVLGQHPGTEYVAAVASTREIKADYWFPEGTFAELDNVFEEEGLEQDGYAERYWVEDDPELAIDLINARLVPARWREDGYGSSFIDLQVGEPGYQAQWYQGFDGITDDEPAVTEIYHYYQYDPWGWDPYWDPWWGGARYPRHHTRPIAYGVYGYDPYWYGYDPYVDWDLWVWGGSGWGWSAGVQYTWGDPYYYDAYWHDPWRRRYSYHRPLYCDLYTPWTTHLVVHDSPAGYWGSTVKWKGVAPDRTSPANKYREGEEPLVRPAATGGGSYPNAGVASKTRDGAVVYKGSGISGNAGPASAPSEATKSRDTDDRTQNAPVKHRDTDAVPPAQPTKTRTTKVTDMPTRPPDTKAEPTPTKTRETSTKAQKTRTKTRETSTKSKGSSTDQDKPSSDSKTREERGTSSGGSKSKARTSRRESGVKSFLSKVAREVRSGSRSRSGSEESGEVSQSRDRGRSGGEASASRNRGSKSRSEGSSSRARGSSRKSRG